MLSSTRTPSVHHIAAEPSAGRGGGHRALAAGALLTVAALVGGCGSADDSGSQRSAAVEEYAQRKYGDAPTSPVADFLGYSDPEKMSAAAREQNKKTERKIADCMQAEGFEYVPNLASAASMQPPDIDLTQEEYAKKWGFGMTTTMSTDGSPVEDAPGFSSVSNDLDTDPNQAIVAAMSDSERQAYETALYGASFSDDGSDAGAETSVDEAPLGCQSEAYGGDDGPSEASEKLQKLYDDLMERTNADPREKAAVKAYRACMSAAGYPKVKTVDDVYSLISKKSEELYNTFMDTSGDSTSIDGGDPTSSEDSGDSGDSGDSVIPSDGPMIDPEKLAAAQKYERKLAVAEFPCRAEYSIAHEKVAAEYEKDLLEKNKSTFEAVKAEGLG